MHVSVLQESMSNSHWEKEAPQVIRKIFVLVKSLHGTISGEHGVGWIQREYLDIVFTKTEIQLMQAIKKVFDPKLILNPQKILY